MTEPNNCEGHPLCFICNEESDELFRLGSPIEGHLNICRDCIPDYRFANQFLKSLKTNPTPPPNHDHHWNSRMAPRRPRPREH